MFKGREKETIYYSVPTFCYIFAGQKKNMTSFIALPKSCFCDTQVTLFSFHCEFTLLKIATNTQIQRQIQSYCYYL